jgi:type I restriction-modification system DNA methylase subunit
LNGQISQDEINAILWRACDTFRGTVDPAEYKNYILVMLFVKYISDAWRDHYDAYRAQLGDDEARVRRRMGFEKFKLPEGADFPALHAQRNAPNLGEVINIALEAIENANKEKLEGVFRNIDFNSEAALGRTKQRNERLQHLLNDFADPKLDLRPSRIGNRDIIGDAYEFLIGKFAAGAGKKAGEFYTHMIETTYTDPAQNGRVGVIGPHGVLFRGGAEGLIRRKLVEENLLDAVIGLPPNLFFGTGIPAVILIFKRNRPDDRVLFIDASGEFEAGVTQNQLRTQDIEHILATYRERRTIEKYA